MPEFLLGIAEKKTVVVARKQVFHLCIFRLPEAVKERMPFDESALIECDKVMGFYCDPVPGDQVEFKGHIWKVTSRRHRPTRRGTQDKKYVSIVNLEYFEKVRNHADQ